MVQKGYQKGDEILIIHSDVLWLKDGHICSSVTLTNQTGINIRQAGMAIIMKRPSFLTCASLVAFANAVEIILSWRRFFYGVGEEMGHQCRCFWARVHKGL